MHDVSIISLHGKTPRIHDSAFIAPGCRIIGDVEIGPDASIWYNCVIRADVNRIVIGARTNVQDGTVIHCDSPRPGQPDGFPTLIGEDVLIGHMAMIHGCVLEDRAFVGLGSIVMDGCRIGGDAMLAAGAMLTLASRCPVGSSGAGARRSSCAICPSLPSPECGSAWRTMSKMPGRTKPPLTDPDPERYEPCRLA